MEWFDVWAKSLKQFILRNTLYGEDNEENMRVDIRA